MVIDRIEGQMAVLELDGQTIDIPLKHLPEGAREGARLRLVLDSHTGELQKSQDRLVRLQAKDDLPDHIEL